MYVFIDILHHVRFKSNRPTIALLELLLNFRSEYKNKDR
jgi:hypothetical protein